MLVVFNNMREGMMGRGEEGDDGDKRCLASRDG